MAKKKQSKESKAPSEKEQVNGSRPKGPIGKDDMVKVLCSDATYDFLDQWDKDIYFYAEGSDVTDTIRAVNEKVEEDIYYSKLFVMELLAANAKVIDESLLDKMVRLFCDNFTQLRAASAHFIPSKEIEMSALTGGFYLQLKKARKDPAAFLKELVGSIPKEVWDGFSGSMLEERSTIPLLVAMKAVEDNLRGAEWAFLQGLATGYSRKVMFLDEDTRWDFKYNFNKVLDLGTGYNSKMAAYVPFLVKVETIIADPEVKDDLFFWLSARFEDLLQGDISSNEELLKDLFNVMLALSKDLKPQARPADRFPPKLWDTLSEAMKGPAMSSDTKAFFAGILNEDKGTQGQTVTYLGNDIEAQLAVLRSSSAPNERFLALDRLRSILVVNLVPLSQQIRDLALGTALSEAEKETDRLVRNGLIDLVLEAGGPEHMKALRSLLEKHLDDPAWKDVSETQVNAEPYGELYYKDFPSRTVALMGIVSKSMNAPPDDEIKALAERLSTDSSPEVQCLCNGYLLMSTEGEDFYKTVLRLIESDLPLRAVLSQRLKPLFTSEPMDGGVQFEIKEDQAQELASFLMLHYRDASEQAKARMRRLLLQLPSADLREVFIDETKYRGQDEQDQFISLWLGLDFLEALGPKASTVFAGDLEVPIRVWAQVALEALLEDPEAKAKIATVDIFKVMKELGLKLAPMKLVGAVLNDRLTFDSVIPALEVLTEGDWDIFLNETVNLFNAKLDGIEVRLDLILTKFCRYIRDKHTKWYEGRWFSPLSQMVLARSVGGTFMGFWTEKDRELALFWVKEDHESNNWSVYIAILWNISDEDYRIKKVVPAILKNWREDALWALGELDRLDEPLDVISTDKALAVLYGKVWDKFPDSRKALMERWFSTEHFVWAYRRREKAKKDEKAQLEEVLNAGLTELTNRISSRCRNGVLDLSKPFAGSGPLVEILEEIVEDEPVSIDGLCSLAMYCLLLGGWVPFLGKIETYVEKVLKAQKEGKRPSDELKFVYSDDPNDNSLPALLLRAIGEEHVEALGPLMRLIDGKLLTGMEGWAGMDGKYNRLIELLAGTKGAPANILKDLEGHEELRLAYLLKLRKDTQSVQSHGPRPRPSGFGANPILYDL